MSRNLSSPGRRSASRRALFLVLPPAVIGVLALGGYLIARSASEREYQVRVITDVVPMPAMMARRIAANSQRQGLVVDLEKRSVTALEALDLVDKLNPIDVALVPGGVAQREYPNVRQVAELAVDPIELVVRADLAAKGVSALRGRRINLGAHRSATDALARDLLRFAGMDPPDPAAKDTGDYIAENSDPQDLQRVLARLDGVKEDERERVLKELPDAVFILAPLPSQLARDLVNEAGFRLQPLPFADAYCLDRVNSTPIGDVTIDRAILSAVEIPAYTYGIDPAVPSAPCRTIATRLIVVAHSKTDPEAISRLLATIYDAQVAGLLDPKPLRGMTPLFPLHKGTEVYMRRNEPLLSPEAIEKLGKGAGGLGAFASGMVAFYGFLRLRQLRRFESYYLEVRRLELVARGHEDDPNAPVEPAARKEYLENRLLDLKSQAVHDFAQGGLKGDGLMNGIVSLVNDARRSIERIAHAPEYPIARSDERATTEV